MYMKEERSNSQEQLEKRKNVGELDLPTIKICHKALYQLDVWLHKEIT